MNALHIQSEWYKSSFIRTVLTDTLLEISGSRLDAEIIVFNILKNIIASTKVTV